MDKKSKIFIQLMNLTRRIPLPALRIMAKVLARILTSVTQAKTLAAIRLNLEIAFPQLSKNELNCLVKKTAENEIISYFEFFHIWASNNQENINRIHKVEGQQWLHEAIQEKSGIVFIVPHFGTWEIMNGWLSQYTNMTIMYKPIKNHAVDDFVRKARSREHAHLVPTDETGIKQIFKALKQGGTTAILPDHSPDHRAEFVEWFNVPLESSQLSAKLIQKTKARACLLYALRNDQHGFDIHIEPISSEIYQPKIDGTLLIHQTLEQLIKRYPEHYHWSYKRFNAHPETKEIYDLTPQEAINIIRNIQK